MLLYVSVGSYLFGILTVIGVSQIAELREKRSRKHILGSIKDKLKYEGKIKKIGLKSDKKVKQL